MSIKTATITFHAAHNYGSMLQAFALQQALRKCGCDNEIIDFRTDKQRELYKVFTRRRGIKYILKNICKAIYYRSYSLRFKRFEDFANKNLKCTKTCYHSLDELQKASFQYDCVIAGSDQIWNPVPADFDWAYYLPFVHIGKKISYAPSFGPLAQLLDNVTLAQIGDYLKGFDYITVRDENSKAIVEKASGKHAEIVVDPTLLLTREEWQKLLPHSKSPQKEYIFFYTLFANKEIIHIVNKISKALHMPVVVSNFSNQYDFFNTYQKNYSSGPLEFLNLIVNAKLVITSSFHASVFSTLFNIPFFAINGDRDARISQLLHSVNLLSRTINMNDLYDKLEQAYECDFSECNRLLAIKRQDGLASLHKMLAVNSKKE